MEWKFYLIGMLFIATFAIGMWAGWFLKDEQDALARKDMQEKAQTPSWISVAERLPDDGARVIAYSEGSVFDCECDKNMIEYGESPLGWWRLQFDPVTLGAIDSEWVEADATHWMPLQAPPEVQENG